MPRMKRWVFVILLFGLVAACLQEPDCVRSSGNILRIAFKKKKDGTTDTLKLRQIYANGTDSIFYAPAGVNNRTFVDVVVNPYADTTSFRFEILNEEDKKFKVGYSRTTRFISPDCGTETFIRQLEVLESDFDSLQIIAPELSETRKNNIVIYR